MGTTINQYDVFWVKLDPVEGSEMAKTRPCVIISPVEMNNYLITVTVAPVTSNLYQINWRVPVLIGNRNGMVALDHIRSVSKLRLVSYIGNLQLSEIKNIKQIITEMFVL
jgi:mRNA interferase MazF